LEARRRRRREILWFSSAIVAALLGTVSGLFFTLNGRSIDLRQSSSDLRAREQFEYQMSELAKERDDLRRAILVSEETQRNLIEASRHKGTVLYKEGLSPEDQEQLRKVVAAEDDLSKRLAALESAILQTPEKAVAIPVLKQQITDLQDKYRGDNDAMHGKIGRLYTMMSIFFGSMVALIVGVGGLFFSIFKHRADKAPRSEGDANPTAVQLPNPYAVPPASGGERLRPRDGELCFLCPKTASNLAAAGCGRRSRSDRSPLALLSSR
jgi:hypothetical protein